MKTMFTVDEIRRVWDRCRTTHGMDIQALTEYLNFEVAKRSAEPELLDAAKAALEVVTDDVIQGMLNEAVAKAEGK